VPFIQKYKYTVLGKPQKHEGLDRFLNELREKSGIHVCFSLKELVTCIKNNYVIGIVVDQGAEKGALDIEFFSHLVPTPQGAFYLAKKFDKKIYPTFSHRDKGFYQTLELGEPIDPINKDAKEVLTEINKFYQNFLEKYPWEYNWYYKRFKHKKDKSILVLSDGKAGHTKQSIALSGFLRENIRYGKIKVIEVKYRHKFVRFLADFCAFFSGRNCQGCGKCLFFMVSKETREELDRVCPDFVISTGSAMAPVNKLFSSYIGARSIVILRPNIPLGKFDLAIIPEHDKISADNVVSIKGAIFYPENIDKKINKCRDLFKLNGDNKRVAFFIGGPLGNGKEFLKNLPLFVAEIKKFCLTNKFKILISTSRRTPHNIEKYLEQEFTNFPNIEALVIANRNNYDFVFEGFCLLAEVIFITSESISMLTEAASLGKACVSVSLEKEDIKHRDFLLSMKNEFVFLKKPYSIKEADLRPSSIFQKNKIVLEKST